MFADGDEVTRRIYASYQRFRALSADEDATAIPDLVRDLVTLGVQKVELLEQTLHLHARRIRQEGNSY